MKGLTFTEGEIEVIIASKARDRDCPLRQNGCRCRWSGIKCSPSDPCRQEAEREWLADELRAWEK